MSAVERDDRQSRERHWQEARDRLDGLPAGGLNIAYEAVDRHVVHGDGDTLAFRFLGEDGPPEDITYRQLSERTSRFANLLADLAVPAGSLVFTLSGRNPDLYVAMLGALKACCGVSPLFSAFGPEPVRQRMAAGHGRVLVTTASAYRQKVAPVRDQLPDLEHVLVIGAGADTLDAPGVHDLAALMERSSKDYEIPRTDPEDIAFVHFTSGTTGMPKGAVHVHAACVAHSATGRSVLDLQRGDIYWCTADPGWVTGTSYGLVAPLTCGVTCIVDEAEFDAVRWYGILEDEHVSVWYTAPTALRMLMKAGPAAHEGSDLGGVRHVCSVGEPLNPEVVLWGQRELGLDIHDTWWQTETGAIMIANVPGLQIRPGSMGRPVAGIEIALMQRDAGGERLRDAEGRLVPVAGFGDEGEIAIRTPWPSLMRAYLGAPDRYASCFADGWYLSGDLARRDEDGYVWFVGRGDDVIKSAGHLIGPFEVESVLMEHPAVAEAGVIGVPDPTVGELVKAFVELKGGFAPSEDLRRDLIALGRRRLGAAVAPRSIEFAAHLPLTQSGKIMRRVLKARELGLLEGDLSTLGSTP
ncbi:MAG: acetate--CoA ligase [Actinomycetales bacterium]|nr:acetate--CoA ligase [Actinomycetales bacterium]